LDGEVGSSSNRACPRFCLKFRRRNAWPSWPAELWQRQVFFGFQDAGYRVRVFVEDAVGAGALSVRVDVGPQFVQADADFDSVAFLQAEHHFFRRRIAGVLGELLTRGIHMRRPDLAGGQRVCGGQPHVVMGVHFDFQAAVAAQRRNAA